MKCKKKQAFSILELSIVLMIISLLVGGVISVQNIINTSRLANAKTLTNSAPVTLIKNLELWLETTSKDSFDSGEKVDGKEVTAWYDLNNQLTPKDAGNKVGSITYNKNGINGLPSLYIPDNALETEKFDLGTNYIFSSGAGKHNGMTIFAVVKAQTPNTNNEKFVVDFGLYGGEGYGMCYRTNFLQTYTASGYGGSGANISHNRGEKPTILTFRVKFNDVQEAFINGNEFSASTAITSLSKLSAVEIRENRYFSIGGQAKSAGENRSFVGDIGEIIIYSRALSNSQKEQIEEYLSQKWNIDLTY